MSFRRSFLLPALALLLPGCGNSVTAPQPRSKYAAPTAPESLLVNLQVSYRERDLQGYADLLAPEFRFYFQPIDVAQNGESWTAGQDTTGTAALFRTPVISTIRVELRYGESETPTEGGYDPDVKKIRVANVQLEVDQVSGTTLLVTDQQEFYFRPGRPSQGEDAGRWYVLEWHDLPPGTGAPTARVVGSTWGLLKSKYLSSASPPSDSPAPRVESNTWGDLKTRFR